MNEQQLGDQLMASFRATMRPAIEEARAGGNERLAELLEAMRDVLLQGQSSSYIRSRLEQSGIASFTPDQARALIAVAGRELAREVVQQAQVQQSRLSERLWSSRAARATVVGVVVSAILSLLATAIAAVAQLVLHH